MSANTVDGAAEVDGVPSQLFRAAPVTPAASVMVVVVSREIVARAVLLTEQPRGKLVL